MPDLFQNVIAIVPMRAGSKGLPGKNIHDLAGKPLYQHTLDTAFNSGIEQTVITTDLKDLDLNSYTSVTCIERPDEIAQDDTPMDAVLTDLLHSSRFDGATVVLLQVTSPLRGSRDIQDAVTMFRESSYDVVMSVCEASSSILKYGTLSGQEYIPMRQAKDVFSNRQQLPTVYRPNGSIYVFTAEWYRQNGSLETDKIGAHIMDAKASIDIDTLDDMAACAAVLNEQMEEKTS